MPALSHSPRLTIAGKFFRRNGEKAWLHGVTYGPFGPGEENAGLPPLDMAQRDLDHMRDLGFNCLRLYHPPPEAFLECCAERQILTAVSFPWAFSVDFLANRSLRQEARRQVRDWARRYAANPTVAAYFVANEINAQLVRWLGPEKVRRFVEDLIDTAKQEAPETLITYASYPSAEYFVPDNADFVSFNVYLEDAATLRRYLLRLQNLAGDRPLVISEFGCDTKTHGQQRQAEMLRWEIEACNDVGVAGNFVFAYADEWFNGGQSVLGWDFGLVDRSRQPKAVCGIFAAGLRPATPDPGPNPPRFSVLICTRNGSRTLEECLLAVERLRYPNFEIIAVSDGSTDSTPDIIRAHPRVKLVEQPPSGLSVARNTAAAHATGDIFAYTDDDCVVDQDWLTHLALAFADPSVAAAGGPNIPPPPQNLAQACVIAAPGGPAHVLVSDVRAEHLPGCNFAVRREAFSAIGGFLPLYHAAGDDVDFCWRLQEHGFEIAFCAAAFVWHYRRFSIAEFLRQQRGYGKAEGLLLSQHGGRFGGLGGARWHGTVYQSAVLRLTRRRGRIYSGRFGHAPFQIIYASPFSDIFYLPTSFPWVLLGVVFAINATWSGLLGVVGGLMLLTTFILAGFQSRALRLPQPYSNWRGRLLLWFLLLAQPVVRGCARFYWSLRLGGQPTGPRFSGSWPSLDRLWGLSAFLMISKRIAKLAYLSETGVSRETLMESILAALRRSCWRHHLDDGWRAWDVEIQPNLFWNVRLTTMTEHHGVLTKLNRIRLTSAVSGCTVTASLLVIAVTAVLLFFVGKTFLWPAVGITFVGWLFLKWMHRRALGKVARLCDDAAAVVGLKPHVD